MPYDVQVTADPEEFLEAAGAVLAAEPLVSTVMATVTRRMVGQPVPTDRPQWWALVRDGAGEIAGVAMRTAPFAPYPMFVLPMPAEAAVALARAAYERDRHVGGLNGSRPAADVCAAELARLQGEHVEIAEHTRLFELGELAAPVGVPGRLRAATTDDLDLAVAWVDRFVADADEQAGRSPSAHPREAVLPADILARIEDGSCWFWLDDAGERVSMVGANPPAFGVARIGPVYTPGDQRRRGYAGAATAEVSRILRERGARVCLYTDQANPTSNGIYQAIGYRPVVDQVNLRIVAS